MTNEQIKQAATDFAERGYEISGIDKDPLHKGFYHGALWRINSVWHKPSDIAEPGKDCLVEHMDRDGNVCIRIDWRSEYEWIHECHYYKILRWVYVSDLLPEGKEAGV